jgi:DNA-directed RNA polymerase subunit RPC12/RpoP
MSANSPYGIPCPECGWKIPTTIQQLLTNSVFICQNCGLELRLDREKSGAALASLAKVESGMKSAKEKLSDNSAIRDMKTDEQ